MKDKKATALLEQIRTYQEAINSLEEGRVYCASENAENVTKETGGSYALKPRM